MPRLTRAESQEQTREALVATAADLFLRRGYNATGLEKVAAAAGFSRGAVYSNFASKQQLGLAVLDRVRLERAHELVELLGHGDWSERVAGFTRWAERYIGDLEWTGFEVEFASSTRHLAEVRDELASRRRLVTDGIAHLLRDAESQLDVQLRSRPDSLALHLLSLGIGIGVQRTFDPEVPIEPLTELLAEAVTRSDVRS